MPEDLAIYMSQNGPHFNKYAFEFAVSNMYKKSENGEEEKIAPYTKAKVDELLNNYGVKLKHNHLYDAAYVATMCKADYLGSSIPESDRNLCMYVKKTIDDPDGYDGQPFNRWLSDIKGMHVPVDWSEFV